MIQITKEALFDLLRVDSAKFSHDYTEYSIEIKELRDYDLDLCDYDKDLELYPITINKNGVIDLLRTGIFICNGYQMMLER